MSDDNLKERLAALEEKEDARRGRGRGSPLVLAGAVVAIVALGYGAYYLQEQDEPEEELVVATADEFQDDGSDFGEVEAPAPPPPSPPPEPETTVVVEAQSEIDPELLKLIADLRGEIATLRERPVSEEAVPQEDTAAQERLAALSAELASLRKDADEAEEARAALEKELDGRNRELDGLRMDLELARLGQSGGTQAEAPIMAAAAATPVSVGASEDEQRRLAELERQRLEEAEAQRARAESPIIAFGGSASSRNGGDSALQQAQLSPDADFVRNGAQPAEVTRSEVIANPSNTIVQGTMIQAITETAVDSSLPGPIRAVISEDVHSFDGTRVLIPRGSKLIGRYRSGANVAQRRVTIAWDRIILPNDQTVRISGFGGDELGRSGASGFVDTRFRERFGSATLISLLGALPGAAAGQANDAVVADIVEDTGGSLQSTGQDALGQTLTLGPTIHVDQGSRITVMVDRDLEIF